MIERIPPPSVGLVTLTSPLGVSSSWFLLGDDSISSWIFCAELPWAGSFAQSFRSYHWIHRHIVWLFILVPLLKSQHMAIKVTSSGRFSPCKICELLRLVQVYREIILIWKRKGIFRDRKMIFLYQKMILSVSDFPISENRERISI